MPKKLDTILAQAITEKNIIAKKDLDALIKESDETDESLKNLLIKRVILNEKEILNLFSEKLNIDFFDLGSLKIDKQTIEKVPAKVASYYNFLPLKIKDRVLTIAVSNPLDIQTQDDIRTQLGYDIEIALSLTQDILDGLKKYYGIAIDALGQIASQISAGTKVAPQRSFQQKVEDIEKLAGDASVIKLVNQIILDAYKKRATDIHIEPQREGISLRYRIDGLLYDAKVPADFNNFINAIISRVKIMSSLNIVERRLPQDGRAIVKVADQMLDLRISTIPTPFGESVVIRILPTHMLFNLEKLGLSKRDLKILSGLIQKPHGIIFVTGPTGSGKTTTLYTCLTKINTRDRNIITIEDPIEYEMQGITQIQVLPEIGLDFARGLRSILRHDPDVIMVGEVRDLETAEIAIRVALTGHLIFSTLHTNDAPSGITRLVDIGVEPYLVASSVEAFIAQRLVRIICPECKYEDKKAPPELKELICRDLGLRSTTVKIYRGKGCANCNFTGFFGRTAIYELLLLDELMKDLILKKTPSGQMKKIAIQQGMQTLRQDGWNKVIAGVTTPEEIMKVAPTQDYLAIEKPVPFARPDSGAEPSPNPSDRRIYSRVSSRVNITYKVIGPQEAAKKKGLTRQQLSCTSNISAGGLVFAADDSLAIGTILELKIDIPDGEQPIECLARVVRIDEARHEKYNIAVCFLDITGGQRTRLDQYVETES
jgi:type IV pilus assembly protein PilB